jgi:glutamate synthase (NADPH) small chain
MGKHTGFKEFERKAPSYEPPASRIRHYREFAIPLLQEEVEIQGARCMDCGVPFCHGGCPLGNVIPDFNDLVYRGRWQGALRSLSSTNNFPEFTGRVCPAPCESACVLGIHAPAVTIKNIELSIIERAFDEGWVSPRPPTARTGRTVAVVGSGPAGLACANQLNKAGHTVTVFERADRIGGLLRYGIPDFKLGKDVVQRRVDLLAAEGIVFRTGVDVGVTVPASQVVAGHDAVVLAGGCTRPRDLLIPGRDAAGISFAMDFLTQSNRRVAGDSIAPERAIVATGLDVVVIGGGDTGSDCVGTAIRQGARSVTQIEILPKPPASRTVDTPWPMHPGPRMLATSTSQAEGCRRDWAVLAKAFRQDAAGRVCGIRCARVDWSSGRMVEVVGSGFELKADLVVLAMGFLHPERVILDDVGVEKDERGHCRSEDGFRTSRAGVFTAGDMRRGQSLVVWAILEGRECARQVDEFLTGRPSLLGARTRSTDAVALTAGPPPTRAA